MRKQALLFIIISFLIGCNGEKSANEEIPLTSYNKILEGRWILKSYNDSISNNCTPGQLTHLTENYYLIDFNRSEYKNDTIKNINILTAQQPENDFQIIYNAKSKTNELIQFQEDFSHDGKTFKRIYEPIKNAGSIRLLKSVNDTILEISMPTETLTFIRCNDTQISKTNTWSEYETLILQKLIVGTYRLLPNDKVKASVPIYFQSNGKTNAYDVLYKANQSSTYSLSLTEDIILFNMDNSKDAIILNWRIRGDSLDLINVDKIDFTMIRE